MGIYTPETKWNADDQKLAILMNIEDSLESAFLEWDFDAIYAFLRSYRRHALPKFGLKDQEKINEKIEALSNTLNIYKIEKKPEQKSKFYLDAEDLFLFISQKLKEAGVYYREGKDARHAVLER